MVDPHSGSLKINVEDDNDDSQSLASSSAEELDTSNTTTTTKLARKLRARVTKLKHRLDRLAEEPSSSNSSDDERRTTKRKRKTISSTSHHKGTQTTNCSYCLKLNHHQYECRMKKRHKYLSRNTRRKI